MWDRAGWLSAGKEPGSGPPLFCIVRPERIKTFPRNRAIISGSRNFFSPQSHCSLVDSQFIRFNKSHRIVHVFRTKSRYPPCTCEQSVTSRRSELLINIAAYLERVQVDQGQCRSILNYLIPSQLLPSFLPPMPGFNRFIFSNDGIKWEHKSMLRKFKTV